MVYNIASLWRRRMSNCRWWAPRIINLSIAETAPGQTGRHPGSSDTQQTPRDDGSRKEKRRRRKKKENILLRRASFGPWKLFFFLPPSSSLSCSRISERVIVSYVSFRQFLRLYRFQRWEEFQKRWADRQKTSSVPVNPPWPVSYYQGGKEEVILPNG